ncbi:MAG: outer membrane protein assembly factor [Bacteroidales bacterium]|nr:outer membrane protein assembly factor [Bacteroidales bacterium]
MKYTVFKNISALVCFILLLDFNSYAQQSTAEKPGSLVADSLQSVKVPKDNYWRRLIYGHIDRTFEKKLDLSFVVAPSYTREASFGIGGMATGLYRLDRTDSLMMPSNITLTFNASVKGFYALAVEGNNNFKGNKSRLSYQVAFANKNLDFWGITFDDCDENPVISYQRQTVKIYGNYQYELLRHFYAGATLDFLYTSASKIDDITYLKDQKDSYVTTGLGLSIQYDSRNFIPNPKRGMYIFLRQTIYPEIFGTVNKALWRTTFIADFYQPIWKGGIFALDLYGQVSSKNLPWALREELGAHNRMRGYYVGRYIDNNIVSAQMELRQHIVGRFGCAAWVGAGTVFPAFKEFDFKNVLPNYGLGLRVEVKKNVNARIDFGFGKETSGFVIGISEAF